MSLVTWKPGLHTVRSFRHLSVLYGGANGGSLAEHSHPEVQVSIHFAPRSGLASKPSHVHIYASQQPHAGSWKPGREVVVFQLSPPLLIEVRQELSRGMDFELRPSYAARDVVLEGLAQLARDEFHRGDTFSALSIESIGHMVARHLLRKHAVIPMPEPTSGGLTDGELATLCRFVHDHIPRGFSVRELGQAIRTGPSVLARKLRLSTGLSPWRFVQQQRILCAKEHLRNGHMPIAAQLGYTDQSHFTHAFRRATGLTPKNWRGEHPR